MLTGIPNFAGIINDSILVFVMSNGNLTDELGQYADQLSGARPQRQRHARGEPSCPGHRRGDRGIVVTINTYPNPSGPTVKRVTDYLNLQFAHNANARNWVNMDHAGIVITIGNITPPNGGGKVKGEMKIYDVVGNTVNWMKSDDILDRPTWQDGPVWMSIGTA